MATEARTGTSRGSRGKATAEAARRKGTRDGGLRVCEEQAFGARKRKVEETAAAAAIAEEEEVVRGGEAERVESRKDGCELRGGVRSPPLVGGLGGGER